MNRLPTVIPVVLFALACSTATPDRAVHTSETLSTMQEQLTVAHTRVDTTLASLKNLMSTSPASLRAAYDAYARDLSALDKSAASIRNSNDELRNRTADYFTSWKKDAAKVSSPSCRPSPTNAARSSMNSTIASAPPTPASRPPSTPC